MNLFKLKNLSQFLSNYTVCCSRLLTLEQWIIFSILFRLVQDGRIGQNGQPALIHAVKAVDLTRESASLGSKVKTVAWEKNKNTNPVTLK